MTLTTDAQEAEAFHPDQSRRFNQVHYCPELSPEDGLRIHRQPLTFRRETPYLMAVAAQYAVLLDGEAIGHVYGWDKTRDGTGRWPGARVTEREWHSGTSTPWHAKSRRAAALDVLIRHLGHPVTYLCSKGTP